MSLTATDAPDIDALRHRIDDLDNQMIAAWQERADLSAQIGALRMQAGGTRISLSREQQIIARFQAELGPIGAKLALLILEAGRGAL